MHKKALSLILFLAIGFACSEKLAANPVVSGQIKAGGFQVYYERQGKGAPLLLLHAGLQDHTMWEAQVKGLSPYAEVITIDLPYHGKTTGLDTVLLAQDVVKIVLDSLQLQKVAIAGLSMGAAVAQDFIIAYPERVQKAFLISAGINGFEKKQPVDSASSAWYPQFEKALQAKDTVQAAIEFTKAWAEGIYRSQDRLKKPASQYVFNTTLKNLKLHKMAGWPQLQNNPPAVEKISGIGVPVLLIDGDKDLPYITTANRYMEQTIPHVRRITLKDVAHMLNLEKANELNKAMLQFLEAN